MLDCACGTGRDLYLFHSLGCEVVGSDVSESMLAQARRNLQERGVEASLHEIDYRELPQRFGKRFDAVVCLATSIAEAPNDEEALRALRSMRDVLREGGILVLDQGTTDKQWKEKARFILASDTRKVSRLFVIDYFEDSARYNILDVFHREKGGELTLWSRDLHILLRDDQEKLLIAAGFRRVEFFGSYRFGPYDKETSNRLIAVAYS